MFQDSCGTMRLRWYFLVPYVLAGIGLQLSSPEYHKATYVYCWKSKYCNSPIVNEDQTDQVQTLIDTYYDALHSGMEPMAVPSEWFNADLPLVAASDKPFFRQSYPFFTAATLRAFANFAFDGANVYNEYFLQKDPKNNLTLIQMPESGDVVYVNFLNLDRFATYILPQIVNKIVIVTCDRDYPQPASPFLRTVLDRANVIAWFTKNPNDVYFGHPKLHPIPIGMSNWGYKYKSGDLDILEEYIKKKVPMYDPLVPLTPDPRPQLLFFNFNLHHPMRFNAQKVLVSMGYRFAEEKITIQQYWAHLKTSKYVVSPRGNGEDCFRTWEAILAGAIPIVMNTSGLWPIYRESPVLVLNDWAELAEIDLYRARVPKRSRSVILAKTWFDKINHVRRPFLKNPASIEGFKEIK